MNNNFFLKLGCVVCIASNLSVPSAFAGVKTLYRVGYYGYDAGGASVYQILENQHILCEECLKTKSLTKTSRHLFNEPVFVAESLPAPPSPIIMEDAQVQKTVSTTLSEATIYFHFNKSDLSSESVKTLTEISQGPTNEYLVEGYACSIGGKKFNYELSKRRAKKVARFLEDHGGVVKFVGRGEVAPSSKNLKLDRKAIIKIKENGQHD